MFYIQISNGLLTPEHCENIGPAVWVFMWCIDRVTMIEDDGTGWVLGRKPVITEDIVKVLGTSVRTVKRDLERLRQAGYIKTIRTPRGLQIGVCKAKKQFKKNLGNAVDKSVHKQLITRGQQKSEVPNVAYRSAKNGTSNIRQLPNDSINTNNNKKIFKIEKPNTKNLARIKAMTRPLKEKLAMQK